MHQHPYPPDPSSLIRQQFLVQTVGLLHQRNKNNLGEWILVLLILLRFYVAVAVLVSSEGKLVLL